MKHFAYFLLVCLLMSGCTAGRVSIHEEMQLTKGMSKEQVRSILGEPYMFKTVPQPDGSEFDAWLYRHASDSWTSHDVPFGVIFVNNRVQRFGVGLDSPVPDSNRYEFKVK
jgi:hypothetical protein